MVKNNNKDKSKVLYLLKGLACLGVVFIHCPFPSKLGNMFTEFCCFAVPTFYLITGYFSYDIQLAKIKTRMTNLIKLGLSCLIFYFFMNLGIQIIRGNLIEYISDVFTIGKVFNLIIFCSPTIWIPGWYVVGMIETYMTWLIAIKYNKTELLLKLTPLLFLIGIIITIISNTYFSGFGRFIYIGRALPWFLEGIIIRNKIENETLFLDNMKICILGVLAYFVSTMQNLLETTIKFDYIGTAIFSLCLFLFFVYNSEKIHNCFLEKIG